MACVVAHAAAAGGTHSNSTAAHPTPKRNSISDCSGHLGSSHHAERNDGHMSGVQQQLQQLLQAHQLQAAGGAEAPAAIKVSDPAETDHPILVSFPSFSHSTTADLSAAGVEAAGRSVHCAGHASTAAHEADASSWPCGSSSSCDSPPKHAGSGSGSSQHNR